MFSRSGNGLRLTNCTANQASSTPPPPEALLWWAESGRNPTGGKFDLSCLAYYNNPTAAHVSKELGGRNSCVPNGKGQTDWNARKREGKLLCCWTKQDKKKKFGNFGKLWRASDGTWPAKTYNLFGFLACIQVKRNKYMNKFKIWPLADKAKRGNSNKDWYQKY